MTTTMKLNPVARILREVRDVFSPPEKRTYDDEISPVFSFFECPICGNPHTVEIVLKGRTSLIRDIPPDFVLRPGVLTTVIVECEAHYD